MNLTKRKIYVNESLAKAVRLFGLEKISERIGKNCGADWNEQAKKVAKNYLDVSSFSRDGLIDQLKFDGFTDEQAIYGVEANGF